MNNLFSIPLPQAIEITSKWRTFFANMVNSNSAGDIGSNDESIFRGFRIPLASLAEMMAFINNYNATAPEKINSVRGYLVKDSIASTNLKDIHILLLPILGGSEMPPSQGPSTPPFGQDLLESAGASLIFDFTTPCPSECDPDSPLFSIMT